MERKEFEELISNNNSFKGIESEYFNTPNKVGCFKNEHGWNVYTNDSEGILNFHYTVRSLESAYNVLASKLGLLKEIDSNNLSESDKNDLLYALRLLYHAQPNISNNSSYLKSWIKLVTLNQIKIMLGSNLMNIINNIEERNTTESRYIDSVLIAYYKNITEGLYIKDKLYKMKINEEVISSIKKSKKRKLVK